MPYSIKNTLIPIAWFEEIVAETLGMYERGEDLSNSPLTQAGRKLAWQNKWHSSLFDPSSEEALEQGLRAREKALIQVYHSIKDKGYDGSIIAVWFDNDGQIHLYDGFHRLAVMKYLGIEALVNVETIWLSQDFDYPLRAVLESLPRVGKCTYQPVDDARVSDFPTDRVDSPQRLEYILRKAVGNTILDIGCSEGYFSRELAKKGYGVTAVDADRGKAAVTRYLSTLANVSVDCHWGEGEELARQNSHFDNILYLSVFHNRIHDQGVAKAFLELRKLRGKTKRLFFEVPDGPREEQWKERSKGRPLFQFKGPKFERIIEEATGMKIVDRYKGFRPMLLLKETVATQQPPGFRQLSDSEWAEHNAWERDWWKDCANTFGEQLLQQMYVGYMKLDQFAGPKHSFDLGGRSVVDIGGGPVSLLLRCENFSRAVVVDPCKFPDWVLARYEAAGIEFIQQQAEDMDFDKEFDEAFIYNVLQHVRDPGKVIDNARRSARKIRVFEPLEVGVHQGHPHNLTKPALDAAFGKEGLVDERGGGPGQIYYFGVFCYE